MTHRLVAVICGAMVVMALAGWAEPAPTMTPGGPDPATARAVATLSRNGVLTAEDLPTGFTGQLGYTPRSVVSDGHLVTVDPTGGCSSPFGATRYGFDLPCKTHDLGYDLLRYSDRRGKPLDGSARRAVDGGFARQLAGRCHDHACRASAWVYTSVVRVNSWRQDYRAPAREDGERWVLACLAGVAGALLLSCRMTGRRAAQIGASA